MPAERGKPDAKGLAFFDITDFSPGIYDNGLIAGGSLEGIFPAPPGAADATATFGCMNLPNGGLGPIAALVATASLETMGISPRGNTSIVALANSFQSNEDELIIGLNNINTPSAGDQTTQFYSFLSVAESLHEIVSAVYNFTADVNFCCYPFTTTIDYDSTTLQPVVVLPLTAPDGPTSNLYVYPSVAAPTTFSTDTITDVQPGTAFGHQGRIVAIQINNGYGWPNTVTQYPNEGFSYTDPPLSETWPHQFETFGPENPFGYGAFNSVSAGELFCVKCRGGAIIIQGDLNNPTVTTLPSVKSTGAIYGRTDSDEAGMYYCALRQGAWVWNGGSSSQKISSQLDDEFFYQANEIDSPFYGYYIQRWADWMMFSNNWIYNSTSGGWWRFANPDLIGNIFWYVPGYDTRYMFMAPPTVVNSDQTCIFQYDRSTPGPSFSWQSLPIKLPGEDHVSGIRELVIRASNPYGDVYPQIAASLIDDKGNVSALDPWLMEPGINTVQETRLTAGVRQTTTVAINLQVSGTSYAPVVHGLSVGYRPREHVGIS